MCGLIARERVSINRKLEDLSKEEKKDLFDVLKEKLEYPANLSPSDLNKAKKESNVRDCNFATAIQGSFKIKLCEGT